MAETTLRSLYGGRVRILFYPNSHKYKLEGSKEWLPSVTSVTGLLDKSRVLMRWAANRNADWLRDEIMASPNGWDRDTTIELIERSRTRYEEMRDEAADIGSQVHDWALAFALAKGTGGDVPAIPEGDGRVTAGINAFLEWYLAHKVEFLCAEQLCYSEAHGYVGTYDALACVDGKLSVIDYKTGNGIYTEHHYQLSAYWAAHEEEHGGKVEKGLILHFDKRTAGFETLEITPEENAKNFDSFRSLLNVRRRERELNARR